jgi:hypothetical protein
MTMTHGVTRTHFKWNACCAFDAMLETTGPRGGDAGHGGYTAITITDIAGTTMEVGAGSGLQPCHTVILRFLGDDEQAGIAAALKALAEHLGK